MAGLESFDLPTLELIFEQAAPQKMMQTLVQPGLLDLAKEWNASPYPGWPTRNPAPGTVHGSSGVYERSGDFWQSLMLVPGYGGLDFVSPATHRGYNYGQKLIDGGAPFIGPYRLLPDTFYV